MSTSIKMFISGLIAGLITFGTSIAALLANMPTDASLSKISQVALLAAAIGGLLTALKDWQSYLAKSPKE